MSHVSHMNITCMPHDYHMHTAWVSHACNNYGCKSNVSHVGRNNYLNLYLKYTRIIIMVIIIDG